MSSALSESEDAMRKFIFSKEFCLVLYSLKDSENCFITIEALNIILTISRSKSKTIRQYLRDYDLLNLMFFLSLSQSQEIQIGATNTICNLLIDSNIVFFITFRTIQKLKSTLQSL
jgi:hypothetical protein